MVSVKVSGIVLEGYHITVGGDIHKIMHWVDLDVGVLGLPNGVGPRRLSLVARRGGGASCAPWGHVHGVPSTVEWTMPSPQK